MLLKAVYVVCLKYDLIFTSVVYVLFQNMPSFQKILFTRGIWKQARIVFKLPNWSSIFNEITKKDFEKKNLYKHRKTRVPYANNKFLKERKQIRSDLWTKIRCNSSQKHIGEYCYGNSSRSHKQRINGPENSKESTGKLLDLI